MEPRDMAISQARGRMAFGAAFLVAPGTAARGWIGVDATRPGTRVITRALGARDLALGLGIVIAIDRGAPVRGWLEASALSDAVDFLATLASPWGPGGEEGVRATFKPEFINRLDEIVEFHQLTREEIARIVDFQVAKLVERVRERGVEVELSDEARMLIANLGYDPTYGARPLKRVIQKRLVDKLALRLLEGEFAPGDRVLVDAADGELRFERAGAAQPVAST